MNDEILEKILKELIEIKITTAKQEINLQIHMKRSDMLEEAISLQKEQFAKDKEELQQQIKPIETHVWMVNGALKLAGAIAVSASFVASIIKIISFFRQSF